IAEQRELDKQQAMRDTINFASSLTNSLMAFSDARTEREIRNLEKQNLSEEKFEEEKEKILEEGEEKRRAFARAQQGIAIGETIIDAIRIGTGAAADTPGGAISKGIALAAGIAMGMLQVATIEKQNFATGRDPGLVGNVSRGRNRDNINAMIGGGEFIQDAETTAQYLPELQAMRNGTFGRNGGGGGGTVNVYGVSDEQFLQLTVANDRLKRTGTAL
ncbi:unnamed protein product, partial [marine sediment metagenome]